MEYEDPCFRVVEDVAEVAGPEPGIQRKEDTIGQGDSVIGFQERVLVVREESDPGAGGKPPGREDGGQTMAAPRKIPVGPASSAVDNAHLGPELVPGTVQEPQGSERHPHGRLTKIWRASSR